VSVQHPAFLVKKAQNLCAIENQATIFDREEHISPYLTKGLG